MLPALNRVPLSFEPNVGQARNPIRFIARTPGTTTFFATSEILISLQGSGKTPPVATIAADKEQRSRGAATSIAPDPCDATETGRVHVRLAFLASNPDARIRPGAPLPGRVNYFIGKDASRWRTDIPTYAGIKYRELYPGVDLTYAGTDGRLKSTFTVAPGSDPGRIRWRYGGTQPVRVDAEGNLSIRIVHPQERRHLNCPTHVSTLTEHAPVAWQEDGAGRRPVSARYAVSNDGSIGFWLGSYDRTRPLIIDPTLTYSTYLGGSSADYAYDITVDTAGNAYVTGATASTNFPLANPIQASPSPVGDLFVTKLNASGSAIVYSTYLGGDDSDVGFGIAVDAAGNAYITGETWSDDFPVVNAYQPFNGGIQGDIFVTKLNPSGSALVYSTYIGGCCADLAFDIAVDGTGHAYVTGYTISNNFPTRNAYQSQLRGVRDIVLTKVAPSGSSLVFSTYLGGTGGGDTEYGFDIALDAAGSAYLTGYTSSADFPVVNALQSTNAGFADVFVTKFNPSGSALIYSTYLGGNVNDLGWSVALDTQGNAYITGYTESANFPVLNAIQPSYRGNGDVFVTKINSAGSALIYSTFLGGSNADGNFRTDIKADAAGNAHIAGNTQSTNFPVVEAIQPTFGGGDSDAFVAQINASGSALVHSTYLGGSNIQAGLGDYAYGIFVDGNGGVYVTGYTFSANFPTRNPIQSANAGNFDAFVTKISPTAGTGCTGSGAFRITGRIRTSAGAVVPGVTITLTGSNCTNTTVTSSRGAYTFQAVPSGTYTLAPSKAGCTFTPPSRTVTITGNNARADFVAACP